MGLRKYFFKCKSKKEEIVEIGEKGYSWSLAAANLLARHGKENITILDRNPFDGSNPNNYI